MAIPLRMALAAAVVSSCAAVRMSGTLMSSYDAFRREFGVERHQSEHPRRAALFERRRQDVKEHNAKRGTTWVAALNKYADYTEEEFQGMLGHRLSRRSREADAPAPLRALSFLQTQPEVELAQTVDWRQKLNVSRNADDQGACGSCWAVAAAGAVQTHLEMSGHDALAVSYEQLVDCVPNPDICGGSGGCNGATSELAFEYMETHGLSLRKDYQGYQTGGDGTCRQPQHPAVTVSSFVRLPENDAPALLSAIATQGPAVVSADASNWMNYGSGVFTNCDKDAVINHAILMMGYGKDEDTEDTKGLCFWLIKNSWGPYWGEGGYIRVQRHGGGDCGEHKNAEDNYCGVDRKPLDGVGCQGGPPTLPVCGMCGVLSDSAYPTGVDIAN